MLQHKMVDLGGRSGPGDRLYRQSDIFCREPVSWRRDLNRNTWAVFQLVFSPRYGEYSLSAIWYRERYDQSIKFMEGDGTTQQRFKINQLSTCCGLSGRD